MDPLSLDSEVDWKWATISFSSFSRIFLTDIFHNHMQPCRSGLLFGLLGNILVTSNIIKLLCVCDWIKGSFWFHIWCFSFLFFSWLVFVFNSLLTLEPLATSPLLNQSLRGVIIFFCVIVQSVLPWVYDTRCKVYIDLLFHCGWFYKLSGLLTTLLRDCLPRKNQPGLQFNSNIPSALQTSELIHPRTLCYIVFIHLASFLLTFKIMYNLHGPSENRPKPNCFSTRFLIRKNQITATTIQHKLTTPAHSGTSLIVREPKC